MAIRPPKKTIIPPIQIHMTIGETMKWNWAGGGSFRYARAEVADRDDCVFGPAASHCRP